MMYAVYGVGLLFLGLTALLALRGADTPEPAVATESA